ncbi:MAG: hypothetical protein KAG28_03600 [Cocleimonas sp.]|nr:hypothetical protein [Cocleimonas sp.]
MKYRIFISVLTGLLAFLLTGTQVFAETKPETKAALDKTPAEEKSDEKYKFKPSYITVKDHRKLSPDDWTDPEVCAQCHPRQYEGWKGSMHSNAFKDPVFQALWAMGEKATKGKIRNHCAGCHSPIGTVTNSIKFNPDDGLHGSFSAPKIAENGVSCDVCHTITGSNIKDTKVLEHGNSSFEMDPGKVKRATLKDAKSPFHETEYSEHHSSSKFCGNCHNIFHPENNFPVERTYDEWKYSVYAQNDIQCMDCHMVPVETAIRVADEMKRPKDLKNSQIGGFAGLGGPFRPVVHDHGFVGGNAVVTEVISGKKSGNSAEAIKRLQNVASINLKLSTTKDTLHNLMVRVNNDRAGHHLPTSLTEVRQIWLEVVVTDDNGNELFRSGTKKKDHSLPKGTVIFNASAVDKNGKHTELPWEIVRFSNVNTIPPKGHKDSNYAFNIPEKTKSVTVITKLHYRSFSQHLADFLLGKDKILVPSVEMVNIKKKYEVVKGKVVVSKDDHKEDAH